MFKISWKATSDPYQDAFIIVPDVNTLFSIYWIITEYGRKDSCVPVDIIVSNLDGDEIDMTKGKAHAASYGSYSRL